MDKYSQTVDTETEEVIFLRICSALSEEPHSARTI